MSQISSPLRFGAFELDIHTGELRRDGFKQRLPEQPLQILAMLLERPGEIVSRDELKHRLWSSDTFVDFEHSLDAAVKRLRSALGDSAEHPQIIETLPRHGYRLLVSIEQPGKHFNNISLESQETQPILVRRRGRWMLAAVISIVLSAVFYMLWLASHRGSAHPNRVVIAVLPLQNLSGDSKRDFFVDGITEELINQLGHLETPRIGVIGSTAVMHYKTSTKNIRQIGQELDANYIVEGSVREEGRRIRVTVQLIEVANQTHLWAESYEQDSSDTLRIQTEISHAIAAQVSSRIGVTTKAVD